MKYTSAQANKLLKKIEAKIRALETLESKSSIFRAALGEDIESVRPKYNFLETQDALDELRAQLRKVKHAVNMFNVRCTLPGFGDLTIDQALVYIPQLKNRASVLKLMAERLPRERVESFYSNSSVIDYTVTNYDTAEAEAEYQRVTDLMMALQLALDTVNSTEMMEIDVAI